MGFIGLSGRYLAKFPGDQKMSGGKAQIERTIRIGMPQMAGGCLSENWLLKELGSFHWDYLCNALRRKSHELADTEGRRLYATFVRVRLELEGTLENFHEGDDLRLNIQMARFGRSSLLSTIKIKSNTSSAMGILMSTFSFRTQENNTSLAKSEPADDYDSSITQLVEAPRFFTEYSEIRKRFGKRNRNGAATGYQINPFTILTEPICYILPHIKAFMIFSRSSTCQIFAPS
jgi:probable biosynthetic protein (TIGR04098 family)